ncbi:MAG: hypothetical protein K9N62_11660 [Verrucomicrobia bacterium]|nr:hypothetical protein [Verrucomicrobiota bacterium]
MKTVSLLRVPEYIKLTEEIGTWGGDIRKAVLPDFSRSIMCVFTRCPNFSPGGVPPHRRGVEATGRWCRGLAVFP